MGEIIRADKNGWNKKKTKVCRRPQKPAAGIKKRYTEAYGRRQLWGWCSVKQKIFSTMRVNKRIQNDHRQVMIRIKYHSDKIDRLDYIDGKSDWIDLRSAEQVKLKKGEFKLISLGVSMHLPKGYEAVLVPRSSTYKTFGIIQPNHMGIIDEAYCGDGDVWKMPVLAVRDTQIEINDRICQFRIQRHQPRIVFEETESLGNTDRGGFGSTGRQ